MKDRDTMIMGILNLTPDSFSDGGRFVSGAGSQLTLEPSSQCISFDEMSFTHVVKQMLKDGATILDIGGESTGPGSVDVSIEEELTRVVPAVQMAVEILKELGREDIIVSVDTWKSEVARAAVQAGAGMINDVRAGRGDEAIAEVAAEFDVPYVMMYSKDDSPRTTKEVVHYEDVMKTVKDFLRERVEWAREKGVKQIIIDPGMGAFVSADPRYSWEIIDRIEELYELDCPILVGTSRKSFLGDDRDEMTYLTSAILKGRVDILRVHEVFENATATLF